MEFLKGPMGPVGGHDHLGPATGCWVFLGGPGGALGNPEFKIF